MKTFAGQRIDIVVCVQLIIYRYKNNCVCLDAYLFVAYKDMNVDNRESISSFWKIRSEYYWEGEVRNYILAITKVTCVDSFIC